MILLIDSSNNSWPCLLAQVPYLKKSYLSAVGTLIHSEE